MPSYSSLLHENCTVALTPCGTSNVCKLGPLRVADMPAHSSNNDSTTTEVILKHVKEITAMLVVLALKFHVSPRSHAK